MEKDITFRYIASNQNPSDLVTRGLSASEIDTSTLWWHGPSWLQVGDCPWPVWSFSDVIPEVLAQVKSEAKGPSLTEVSNVAGVDQNVT